MFLESKALALAIFRFSIPFLSRIKMTTKEPKLLQRNKILRSSIITYVRLSILFILIHWTVPYFKEIQSLGLSLNFTQFFFPIYQFFISIYKYYAIVFIASFVLCIDIWRREIYTQEYLKRAFILLQVIRFLEYAMWLLFVYIHVEITFSIEGCSI
ncbi:membrane protein [Beggiatoa sp. PS]|nr:membrane protein [Beggiatoa sp. PS]